MVRVKGIMLQSRVCNVPRALKGPRTNLEQIVTGHARLAGNASGDDDEVSASQGLAELVVAHESLGDGLCVDVADISSNAGGAHHIVQSQLSDSRGHLGSRKERKQCQHRQQDATMTSLGSSCKQDAGAWTQDRIEHATSLDLQDPAAAPPHVPSNAIFRRSSRQMHSRMKERCADESHSQGLDCGHGQRPRTEATRLLGFEGAEAINNPSTTWPRSRGADAAIAKL